MRTWRHPRQCCAPRHPADPGSAWQARQSVCALAVAGAAPTNNSSACGKASVMEETVFMSAPIKPTVPRCGRERLLASLPGSRRTVRAFRSRWLLLQRANVLDTILDLRHRSACPYRQASCPLPFMVEVINCASGRFDHRRILEGKDLHALAHRGGGQAVGAVAHGALGLVVPAPGACANRRRCNEGGQKNHGRRSESLSHRIAPLPVDWRFLRSQYVVI